MVALELMQLVEAETQMSPPRRRREDSLELTGANQRMAQGRWIRGVRTLTRSSRQTRAAGTAVFPGPYCQHGIQ